MYSRFLLETVVVAVRYIGAKGVHSVFLADVIDVVPLDDIRL